MERPAPFLAVVLPLLVATSALAASKSVDEATAADKQEAGNLYTVAMGDFDKNAYEPALRGFRESYDRVKSPNSHFMIARTLARLGRNVEAYEELQAVIAEADELGSRYDETATAARAKREEIRPRVALLTITLGRAPKGTKVVVGEEPLDATRLGKPVAVLPGETTVAAVTPDGNRHPKKISLEAGASGEIEVGPGSTAAPSKPKDLSYIERSEHARYSLEIELHGVGETIEPPGFASRGAGGGGRLTLDLLRTGIVGLNDSVALSAGGDWIGTSNDPHIWIPLVLQWNFWATPELSLMLEPGADLLVGAGTHLWPAMHVGARYQIWERLQILVRVGIPAATLGASWLL